MEVRQLLTEDFPNAPCVTLVCDNLNTHGIASLYAAFPAEEAHRLARRRDVPFGGDGFDTAIAPAGDILVGIESIEQLFSPTRGDEHALLIAQLKI